MTLTPRMSPMAAVFALAGTWVLLLTAFFLIGRSLNVGGTPGEQHLGAFLSERGTWAMSVAHGISTATEWGLTLAVALGIIAGSWWRARRADLPVLTVVTVTGAMTLAWALKYLVDRPRPEGALGVVSPAFPSAHATRVMVLTLLVMWIVILARNNRARAAGAVLRSGAVALLMAPLAVGAARVVLGVHWPSDVVAGWALALLWCAAVRVVLRPARRPVEGTAVGRPAGGT